MSDRSDPRFAAEGIDLADLQEYYRRKLSEHGPVPQGVGWNSPQRQSERFRQLARCFAGDDRFTLLDLGCGYGAFRDFVAESGKRFSYVGTDICEDMIGHAREIHAGLADCRFEMGSLPLGERFDYVVASGIFNMKAASSLPAWERHVFETMTASFAACKKASAWNFLTHFSDEEKMSPELYYADPGLILNFCIENLSRDVELHHHYGIWDFTVEVHRRN